MARQGIKRTTRGAKQPALAESNNTYWTGVAEPEPIPQKLRATLGKCCDRAWQDEAWRGELGQGTANMCHEPFKLITGINLGRKNYALTLSGCHLQHELELVRRYEGGGAGQGRGFSKSACERKKVVNC